MKILHIIPSIEKKLGGTTFALINILKLEKLLGLGSTVLTISKNGFCNSSIENWVTYSFRPSFPSRFSRSQEANAWLRNNIQNFDFVSIHGIWGFFQIEAAHIARKLCIPYIIYPHGSLDPFDLQKKKHLKNLIGPLIVRPMLQHSTFIHCTAQLEAERLEKYGAQINVKTLPLPVVPLSLTGDRTQFRQKFRFANDDFIMLFLSRIDYKKGLDLLIHAIVQLSHKFPNLKLVIAGSDSNGYERKVRSWVAKHKITNKVVFCGFLTGNDKLNAFAGSDCFVLPSLNENFGIAIVESLSASLPVLISDNVYIWKEIINKGGGWVCQYSVKSLCEALSQVLNNPVELKAKRASAVEAARQFLPEVMAPLYFDFYHSILKCRSFKCC